MRRSSPGRSPRGLQAPTSHSWPSTSGATGTGRRRHGRSPPDGEAIDEDGGRGPDGGGTPRLGGPARLVAGRNGGNRRARDRLQHDRVPTRKGSRDPPPSPLRG